MGFTDGARDVMLDHVATRIDRISLHTADPGTTGANELVSSIYFRQRVRWNVAGGGMLVQQNVARFRVPSGTTITHVGFWDSISGEFHASADTQDIGFSVEGGFVVAGAILRLGRGSPPAIPTSPSATAQSSSVIRVAWTASTGATGYLVQGSDTGLAGSWAAVAPAHPASPFDETNLLAATTRYYRVAALNSFGRSGFSTTVFASTTAAPVLTTSAPTTLSATRDSIDPANKVNLSWAVPANAETYNIERSVNGGPYESLVSDVVTSSYADTSVSYCESYAYRVRACNSLGCSQDASSNPTYSPTASVAVTTGNPPAPTNLRSTGATTSTISLAWAPSSCTVGYRVSRSDDSGATFSTVVTGITATSYVDTGLTANKSYQYRVRSLDSAGAVSAVSNTITVSTDSSTPGVCPPGATSLNPSMDIVARINNGSVGEVFCFDPGVYDVSGKPVMSPKSGMKFVGKKPLATQVTAETLPDKVTRLTVPANPSAQDTTQVAKIKTTDDYMWSLGVHNPNNVTFENLWFSGGRCKFTNPGGPRTGENYIRWTGALFRGGNQATCLWKSCLLDDAEVNAIQQPNGEINACTFYDNGYMDFPTPGQAAQFKAIGSGVINVYNSLFTRTPRQGLWWDVHCAGSEVARNIIDGAYPLNERHDNITRPDGIFGAPFEVSHGDRYGADKRWHVHDNTFVGWGKWALEAQGSRAMTIEDNWFKSSMTDGDGLKRMVIGHDGRANCTPGCTTCGRICGFNIANVLIRNNNFQGGYLEFTLYGFNLTYTTDPAKSAMVKIYGNTNTRAANFIVENGATRIV